MNSRLEEAFVTYAEVTGDIRGATMAQRGAPDLISALVSLLPPGEEAVIAFPTMIIRPDIRTSAIAGFSAKTAMVVWKRGLFKKNIASQSAAYSQVSTLSWGPGKTASTKNATILTLNCAGSDDLRLAMDPATSDVLGRYLQGLVQGSGSATP